MRNVEIQKDRKPTVFVDADACPVKEEIISVSRQYSVELVFVASYTNLTSKYPEVRWVWVDPGPESADLYILNHLQVGDLVVTEDMGLAAGCLAKLSYVVTSRGREITDSEIDLFLQTRHEHAKLRRAGKRHKGPKKILANNKDQFLEAFRNLLSKIAGS